MLDLEILDSIKKALEQLKLPEVSLSLEFPADISRGDYSSNVGFILSGLVGRDPRSIANEIVSVLPEQKYIDRVEVAGAGFINFFISPLFLIESIEKINAEPSVWGNGELLKGEHHLIEHSSPNLFKPFHIGHLVNNSIGESIVRLTQSQGAMVTRIAWPSDVSPGIAKAVWGLIQMSKEHDFNISDLGEAYVLGTAKYDELPKAHLEIDEINRQIYLAIPGKYLNVYIRGRKLSLDYFLFITKRLGSEFDRLIFESESEVIGAEIVKRNCPGIFEYSDGAIIYRGSEDGLYDSVFINSQGFGTYLCKDIGLITVKRKDYTFNRSVTITDIQQEQHFKLVLSVLQKIDPGSSSGVSYIHHGRLRFSDGKVSSRLGNVPLAENILEEVKMRLNDDDRPNKISKENLELLAISAIKYSILRVSPGKNIIFDHKQSLSLDGDSGLYLQYTYARAMSVIRKFELKIGALDTSRKVSESNLERLLIRFPNVVRRAAISYEPHHLTQYITNVCAEFNKWYATEQILNRPDTDNRILVVKAVATTICRGLDLLGMKPVDKI